MERHLHHDQLAALWLLFRDRLALAWLRLRLRFTKINQNEQCPVCGHRQGRIEFFSDDQLIHHYCLICRYEWGEQPITELPKPDAITTSQSR
jgi:hypothetical protein